MKRVAVAAMWLAACHRGSIVPDERPAPARADAGAEAGVAPLASAAPDAGPSPKDVLGTGGPFVVVARATELTLERVTGSPVLAVDEVANVLWELDPGGETRLIAPLAEKAITSERTLGIRPGRIAGRWPVVQIELGWAGGRGAATIHNWVVDVAKGTAKLTSVPFGHLASTSPWQGGVEIGLLAEDTSLMGRGFVPRAIALTTFGEPKKPVPKLPSTVKSANPQVAAYDTGRIFVLAGEHDDTAEGFSFDEKMVWTIVAGKSTSVRVAGRATRLLRGRSETETLVAGEVEGSNDERASFVARWDGSTFVPVSLPFQAPLRSLVAADDGSVWAVTGPPKRGNKLTGGAVWRGTLPDVRFERVPLDASFAPASVGATSADDVWLTAEHASLDDGELLLHTQATPPAKRGELPSDPEAIARLLDAKRELPVAGATCVFPFLVLGKDGEVQEADVAAFAKAEPDWPFTLHGTRVTTATGDAVWGIELWSSPTPSKEELAEWKGRATHAKARFPGAKLLCGRLPIQKDVELVPRPPSLRRPTKPPPGAEKPAVAP